MDNRVPAIAMGLEICPKRLLPDLVVRQGPIDLLDSIVAEIARPGAQAEDCVIQLWRCPVVLQQGTQRTFSGNFAGDVCVQDSEISLAIL
jgi:hypothetical protein